MTNTITTNRLSELENIIADGLKVFYRVGEALMEVRDLKLYRLHGFTTFEDYCVEKWDMKRAHAHRLIVSSEVVKNIENVSHGIHSEGETVANWQQKEDENVSNWIHSEGENGYNCTQNQAKTLPQTESQTRELAKAPAEDQAHIWSLATSETPKPTAKEVKAAVEIFEAVKHSMPEMTKKQIKDKANEIRREEGAVRHLQRLEKIANISKGNKDVDTSKKYAVIYADPAWRYDFSKDSSDEIENHYPTMSVDEICALPVGDMALNDCVLYMWATAPKLLEAIKVIEAWGFTYKTHAVWDKQKIGMGFWFRGQHELLTVSTRGSIPAPKPENRYSSVFSYPRGKHSVKPEEFYEVIESAFPLVPKVELFARNTRSGWDAWGNQSNEK